MWTVRNAVRQYLFGQSNRWLETCQLLGSHIATNQSSDQTPHQGSDQGPNESTDQGSSQLSEATSHLPDHPRIDFVLLGFDLSSPYHRNCSQMFDVCRTDGYVP